MPTTAVRDGSAPTGWGAHISAAERAADSIAQSSAAAVTAQRSTREDMRGAVDGKAGSAGREAVACRLAAGTPAGRSMRVQHAAHRAHAGAPISSPAGRVSCAARSYCARAGFAAGAQSDAQPPSLAPQLCCFAHARESPGEGLSDERKQSSESALCALCCSALTHVVWFRLGASQDPRLGGWCRAGPCSPGVASTRRTTACARPCTRSARPMRARPTLA